MKEKAQILFTLLIIGSCCCYVIKMSYVNRQKYNIYQNKANVPNFGNLISKRKEFDSDFEFLLDTMQSLDNLKAPSYILCDYWNRLVSRIDLNRELSVIEKNLLLDSANLFMTQLLARSHNSQDKLKIGQQVVYLSSKLPFIMRNTDTLNLVLQVAFIGEQIEFIKQIIEFISNSAINNPKEFNKKISINARSLCILINGFSDSDTNIYSNHSINSNFNIIKMIYNLLPLLKEKNDLNISEKEELFVHNAYLKSIFSSSSTTITNAHGFDIYNYLLQQNKVDSFSLSLALKKCLDTRDYDRCKKLWSTSVEHGCIKQPHRITKSIMVNILCSGILADNHNNKQELSINSFASAIKIIEQDVCDEVLSPLMHSLGCLAIEPSEVLSCLRQLVPLEQDNTINDDANSNNDGPPILSLIQGYLSESATSEVIKTYSLVYHIQDYNVEEGIPSRCITGNTKVLNVLIQAVRLKRIANDDYDLELVKLWQFISNVILKRLEFVQNMKTRLDQRKLVDQYTMASGIELATSMGDSSFAFLFWNKLMKIKFKVSSRIVHALLRSFGSWKRLEGTVTPIDPDVVVEQLSLFRNTIRDLTTYKHFTSIIDNRMIDEACHAALRLNSVDEARRTLDMFRFRARENMKVHSKEKDIRHPSFSGGIMNMLIHVERDWRSSEYLLSDSNNDVVQQLDWISSTSRALSKIPSIFLAARGRLLAMDSLKHICNKDIPTGTIISILLLPLLPSLLLSTINSKNSIMSGKVAVIRF